VSLSASLFGEGMFFLSPQSGIPPFGVCWYCGVNWCQICGTNLDRSRARRPGSVRPARVPSVFQQVISPGYVRERTQAGTCPRWTSASPTTLTCMLICIRAWPASLCRGVPLTGFSHPTCSRTGRVRTKPALTALPWCERENLSLSHMRSILHQQDRLVKTLVLTSTHKSETNEIEASPDAIAALKTILFLMSQRTHSSDL
jgi:hypothetical protein